FYHNVIYSYLLPSLPIMFHCNHFFFHSYFPVISNYFLHILPLLLHDLFHYLYLGYKTHIGNHSAIQNVQMYLLIHAPLWKISFLPLGINYQTVLSLALCPYDETFVINLLVNILCFPKEKPENKSYYYSGKTSLGTVNRLFQNYI